MKRRKKFKGTLKHAAKTIAVKCSYCETICDCSEDTVAVTCWKCCMSRVPSPRIIDRDPKLKVSSGFPRGWKFYKQFVHSDGRVFTRGVEQPKLKGTLAPTDTTKKEVSKLSKFERRRLKEQKQLRKMKRLAKRHEKKGK